MQALTLAMAVRLKVAKVPVETARQLVEDVANLAVQGFETGKQMSGATTSH